MTCSQRGEGRIQAGHQEEFSGASEVQHQSISIIWSSSLEQCCRGPAGITSAPKECCLGPPWCLVSLLARVWLLRLGCSLSQPTPLHRGPG